MTDVKPKPVKTKAIKPAAKAGAKAASAAAADVVTDMQANIPTGVQAMTNTTEKTAETVTAKAQDFFAGMQVRAAEAAEKGKTLAADAVEFQKANFAAIVEAGKIAAKGAQDMGKTNADFAKANFAELQAAVKEIAAVRTPTDFVKIQSELAKKAFDIAVAQGSKNTEATVKLVSDMFQPISNRIAVTTEFFKKAA